MKNGNSKLISDLEAAYQEWVRRQARETHPDGKMKYGRWYPDPDEKCNCCEKLRNPTKAYPYTLQVHCRTQKHVAFLFGVDRKSFKAYVKNKQARTKSAPEKSEIAQIADDLAQAEKHRIAEKIATAIVSSLTPEQRLNEQLKSLGYVLY